jgi:DMATS type aromatic prenyltransferase
VVIQQPRAIRVRPDLEHLSYAEIACDMMLRACQALGWDQGQRRIVADQLIGLMKPWGSRPMRDVLHRSFLANDEMPVELSFAWSRRGSEARAYFEALGDSPTAWSCQDAGVAVMRRLDGEPGVWLGQYRAVEDLFIVPGPRPPFCIWTGVVWRRGEHPWYKVFLNPQVCGRGQGGAVTAEAMRRLGLERAWAVFCDHLGQPDFADSATELAIFCLDLRDPGDARVRVYIRHAGADARVLDHVAACARNHQPGAIARVWSGATGHSGPCPGKPPITTIAFRSGEPAPAAVTVNIPLDPNLANDAVARERVSAVLRGEGIDPAGYLATVHALTDRPLTQSALQSWFAYRPGPEPRGTVYFSTGAYETVSATI